MGRGRRIKSEFDQRVLDLARVTRVVKGGRRFRFRASVILGNYKGKVGMGIAKGADASSSINKAVNKAKKALINVEIINGTINHQIIAKFKSAKVLLKPAKKGRGLVAGGAIRQVIELAGISDITTKMLGRGNKINNAFATLDGLAKMKPRIIRKNVPNIESKVNNNKEGLKATK